MKDFELILKNFQPKAAVSPVRRIDTSPSNYSAPQNILFSEQQKRVAYGEKSYKSTQNLSNLLSVFGRFGQICKISAPKGALILRVLSSYKSDSYL